MPDRMPGWLNEAIFYQIYPQSYYDASGDGIGDIPGIIEKLDYIEALGVNALWLNPCFVSPFQDAGYDVADYYQVAPRYGTNGNLKRLFKEAHRRGIRVCLDLVPGHTSIEHPWFKASCRHRRNQYSDRYVWSDSVWEDDESDIRFISGYAERNGSYATNFFYCQPALNYGFAQPDPNKPWQQPVDGPGPKATRRELKRIMDFWLGQGADGFRVDMAASLVKKDPDHQATSALWREVRAWIQRRHPDAVLISEWGNPREAIAAGFHVDFMLHFGAPGYDHLLLQDDCFFRRRDGQGIRPFLDAYLAQVSGTEERGYVAIPSANHDFKRPRSDGRTMAELEVIFTFLLTWPGIPFIYYGDEIGMRYIKHLPSKEGGYERTGTRTPMQWDDGRNAGFSSAQADQLYLPVDPGKGRPTVQGQDADPRSLLNLVRRLTALRRDSSALQAGGTMTPLHARAERSAFVYLREQEGERFLVALNPAARAAEVEIDGVTVGAQKPEIGHGVEVRGKRQRAVLKMDGVSYGVFRL